MAEIFVGPLIKVLLGQLASGDLWKLARKERTHTLLKKLRKMLEQVQAVVADAEEKQIRDGGVTFWLSELEDLSYDMDDVLDVFATEALRRNAMKEPGASTSKVRAIIPDCCINFNPVSDFRMRSKMDEITKRLQDLYDRRVGLGLQTKAEGGPYRAPQSRITSSLPTEPCFHGRDKDKNEIMDLLLSDQSTSNRVGIVPIVGMGGVGKTTLAQMVYNDPVVDKHFEKKVWVCVSEEFSIMGVTKAILESVTSQTCESKELDYVQVQLKRALAGKKFLIVLDDVWNEDYHELSKLKSPFSDGALGSKVIVTTRSREVALIMAETNKCHFLTELSEDDCWLVFAQHAFKDGSMDENPNLVSIGREIIKKCKGLPLAARTLGGLLCYKFKEDEWEGVLNSKMWELPEERSHILPALRLSYHHLPLHLKKCFAYCSIFPKDYEFEEEELVFLWMAEGLIPKQNGHKQIEDLGSEYFNELLSRSLFQPASSGELFVMHDLISDLAQFLTRKVYFRLEDKLKEIEGEESIIKARHSSYSRGYSDGIKRFKVFHKAKNLRTFLPLGSRGEYGYSCLTSNVPLYLLPGLKRLRVLSLGGYRVGELPNSIGDLKHVRYLDLSHAVILTLTESITTLYNLQTLILRYCKYLKKLPANTSNLINLRHLNLTGTNSFQEMPPNIGKLTSLQTLSKFIVGNGSWSRITELGNLIHLGGSLSILVLENVRDALDAGRANLKDKQGLNVLLLEWSNILDDSRDRSAESRVLHELEPHKSLKDLSIVGYGGLKFPTWVGNHVFTNMVCLKIQNCQNCTSLPPLGQLPLLAKLYIQGMEAVRHVGLEFYGSGRSNPFQALEILSFVDMPEWEDWTPFVGEEGAQAFARLSKLSIRSCPKLLHELPRNLPRLRELDIKKCPAMLVAWDCSPIELNEVSNMLHFDSLVSLYRHNVLIPDPFRCSEVGDHGLLKNSWRSLLTSLWLDNIRGHKCLPSWFFQGLTGLQELRLYDCDELTTLWENEVRQQSRLPALRRLKIYKCPKLITLFAEGDDLNSLQDLFISQCPSLISFPVLPSMLKNLYFLRCDGLLSLPDLPSNLRNLSIENCDGLLSLPDLALLNNLEELELDSCGSLIYLSSRRGLPPALKKLSVFGCKELKSLIAEDGMEINCPSLEVIQISYCEALKTLPDVLQSNGLRKLSRLDVRNCKNLESLPEGWFPTTNLRELVCCCEKLQPLPSHTYTNNNLASLEKLGLKSSPMGAGLLFHILDEGNSSYFTNLTQLHLYNFDVAKLRGLRGLSSLRALDLSDCDWVSAPEDGMLWFPSSLITLRIWGSKNLEKLSANDFGNLVSLESLEELNVFDCPQLTSITELGQLPSLLRLWVYNCPILASFGDKGLPPSLLYLEISDCPILKQRCEKEKGQYWKFIAPIPYVQVDGRIVFDPSS